MFVNEMHHGGIRALLDYDNTIFDNLQLPEGVEAGTVIDRIIFKYGDTPLFAPDPAVVKYYIGRWSDRKLSLWERFKAAVETEYKPLENYDRIEEGEVDFQPKTTLERRISADNAADYQPDTKDLRDGKDLTKTKLRAHGNIGVTTSQQMLQSEIDLIPNLDLIEFIADDFRSEFCLDIYY